MTPTYAPNEILRSKRIFSRKKLDVGDVVVVKFKKDFPIEGQRIVIKRISDIKGNKIFLLGDNADASYDSRYYGYVPVSFVMCYIKDQRPLMINVEDLWRSN